MTPARAEALERGLTVVAARVLDAVPIQEAWSATQVHNELVRQGRPRMDLRVLHGCLASLKESGLVKEPARGAFSRIAVRLQPPRLVQEEPVMATPVPILAPVPTDPLPQLGILAESLRKQARTLLDCADAIDSAALLADERIKDASRGGEKLRELQKLLKGIVD